MPDRRVCSAGDRASTDGIRPRLPDPSSFGQLRRERSEPIGLEIEIERMRRHVGTFGHEAHVAQRAGFSDSREILRFYAIDIFGRAAVDQIE